MISTTRSFFKFQESRCAQRLLCVGEHLLWLSKEFLFLRNFQTLLKIRHWYYLYHMNLFYDFFHLTLPSRKFCYFSSPLPPPSLYVSMFPHPPPTSPLLVGNNRILAREWRVQNTPFVPSLSFLKREYSKIVNNRTTTSIKNSNSQRTFLKSWKKRAIRW